VRGRINDTAQMLHRDIADGLGSPTLSKAAANLNACSKFICNGFSQINLTLPWEYM
jgi:hypothetical protein